ncbi:hypothetical protein [Salinimicrobium oceani]|uniref:Uncharacterized protein n=1 Tax=Salinimicrobium oceani TaxID=2722702 RepID=A0ABX1CZC3_9FLAO|nr:hypothetical protein [Salinimicrobium oceani]NJW52269.1 hypothetical protein [Salinimicrobium oceani]
MVIARIKIISILISFFLVSCGKSEGPPVRTSLDLQNEATVTPFTVRLPGGDPETQAILLTQTVYAATREDNAVGAIILVPQDEEIAFTTMHRVTHMPVNAPMLFLDKKGAISEATFAEMKRLKPDGVMPDGRKQVYAVNVPAAEVKRIQEELNYEVRTFYEDDPILLAEVLDRWQAALKSDHPDEVVISAIDHPDGIKHGMGAMGWNAHMGRGFAWVYQDSVPEATKEILRRRFGDHGAYMYVTGNAEVISDKVVKELGEFGLVRRIAGPNFYASNTVNAGYKDYGRNFGWGWGWSPRNFGWGIAQAGHNFIFSNAENVLGTIPAAVLGHMGKHGPILLVDQDELPNAVEEYLKMVKPFPANPQETILNFGWIIGNEDLISRDLQFKIDQQLSPFDNRTVKSESDTLTANSEL